MADLGSVPEWQLLARNAQKLTGRFRHHKPNGSKLPSLKKICHSAIDPVAAVSDSQID
jgi:hypothetical protein